MKKLLLLVLASTTTGILFGMQLNRHQGPAVIPSYAEQQTQTPTPINEQGIVLNTFRSPTSISVQRETSDLGTNDSDSDDLSILSDAQTENRENAAEELPLNSLIPATNNDRFTDFQLPANTRQTVQNNPVPATNNGRFTDFQLPVNTRQPAQPGNTALVNRNNGVFSEFDAAQILGSHFSQDPMPQNQNS